MKKGFTFLFCLCIVLCGAQENTNFRTIVPGSAGNTDLRSLLESLIGEGMVLKNYCVTRKSATDAFGFFEDDAAALGMTKGFLMTSGGIRKLTGRNSHPAFSCTNGEYYGTRGFSGTYPELSRLLKNNPPTFDACVIELDVVPTSDTLSFNYVFGSEEYDEYVGSQFNDVFGFFISGKGINGDVNLAVVPGTDVPVSINTINGGSLKGEPGSNAGYYVRNTAGQIGVEYDGLTRLMQIRQPVIAYETYHLKMAIADVSDDAFDSGVFIEGKSFISYRQTYNVLFDANSSELAQGYKNMLNGFVKAYYQLPSAERGKITVTGHTDDDGGQEQNDELSAKRSANVQAYLLDKGVPLSELIVISKGENMPRADNLTAEGKHLNRRVELKMCGSITKYRDLKTEEYAELGEQTNALLDNFPNPFLDNTVLRAVILPTVKNADLIISDSNGKSIRVIHVLERGKTEVTFDSESLVAGIYLATLLADGKVAGTVKMTIQR